MTVHCYQIYSYREDRLFLGKVGVGGTESKSCTRKRTGFTSTGIYMKNLIKNDAHNGKMEVECQMEMAES